MLGRHVGWFFTLVILTAPNTLALSISPPAIDPEAIAPSALPVAPPPFADPDYPASPPRSAIDIGHNVTATSSTFAKGQCTVGLQIVGCGINDRTSLAFSPWLFQDYQMANVALRYLVSENGKGDRWAFQTEYFHTWTKHAAEDLGGLQASNGHYEMQALWLMGIRTWTFKPDYHLHLNIHTNYYFNEKMPFSLRRPYLHDSAVQLNISTLHEMDLVRGWVIKGELGLIDVLRAPLHFHSGVTIGRRVSSWHWHVGFSMTTTYHALVSPTQRYDYQQSLRVYEVDGYDTASKSVYGVDYDFSIHPEFSLQYYF